MTWPRVAQVLLAIAIFSVLAWRLDAGELGGALGEIDLGVALVATAINVPIIGLFGIRSHLVLRRMGYSVAPDIVVAVATVGNVAGSLTPASSGEILRAAALRAHTEASTADAVALVFFERGLSVYVMTLGTAGALAAVALPAPAAVACCVALGVALLLPRICSPLLRDLPQAGDSGRLSGPLARLRETASRLSTLLSTPGLMAGWMTLTAGVFVLLTLQFWLLARATEDVVSPWEVWVAIGASQLAAILSLIPLGLGASDASLAAILNRFSMTLESGTAVAVLARATSTLPMLIAAFIGYVYLVRRAARADHTAKPAHPTDKLT